MSASLRSAKLSTAGFSKKKKERKKEIEILKYFIDS